MEGLQKLVLTGRNKPVCVERKKVKYISPEWRIYKMKRNFYIGIAIILSLSFILVGYGAWLNYSDEDQIARSMDSRRVELSAARVMKRDFLPIFRLDAVRFSSDNMTDAVALTDGRIVRWHVGKNTNVTKDQLLVTMSNENLPIRIQEVESSISRGEAMLAQTYSSYQRQTRLLARRATSQEKYEEAEAQYLAAQSALKQALAQKEQLLVQQDWLNVVSPLTGEVLIIYQQEGAYVQAGTPVALVGDFSSLHFSLNLSDMDIRHLTVGQQSMLTFPEHSRLTAKPYDTDYAASNDGLRQRIKATLANIEPPLDEPADIRRTVWDVDNRSGFLEPMLYGGVTMQALTPYKAMTVPLAAMRNKAHNKVFVIDAEGVIHSRMVTAGANDGKYIEIFDGISEGEQVVVGSFEGLEDGMKVDAELMEGEQ